MIHPPTKTLSRTILVGCLLVSALSHAGEPGQEPFAVKTLSLSAKKEWLVGLSSGPESFRCKDDKDNYRTEECSATFERKECREFKIPQFPYVMSDCKSVYPSLDTLPPTIAQMATVGGNRVKVVSAKFFEGRAVSLTIFHEGLNRTEFVEGLKARFGPPSSEVRGSRDAYDDVIIWSRGGETLKAGAARLELWSEAVVAERKKRFADDAARAQLEAMKRQQETKAKAKSDI